MNSAAITSPRRLEIERAVCAYAQDLLAGYPEVIKVIWFGSWVTGHPSRHSDVDICLLLSSSPHPRMRDRIPVYLPDRFPGGIDLFPYTIDEFKELETDLPTWWRTINAGQTVARRDPLQS